MQQFNFYNKYCRTEPLTNSYTRLLFVHKTVDVRTVLCTNDQHPPDSPPPAGLTKKDVFPSGKESDKFDFRSHERTKVDITFNFSNSFA